MSARENILARVRKNLGRAGAAPTDEERAQVAVTLAARSLGPQPSREGDLIERFKVRALALETTIDLIEQWSDAPPAAARYLRGRGLPCQGVVWPALSHLDWGDSGLQLFSRKAQGDDLVGVSGAFCAIAETGTLLILGGKDTPTMVSLMPETHIAFVAAHRIVATMEDAWRLVREERGELPRACNFISGPSRTADIEQTVVIGAHGPYRVHVVIVNSPGAA